MRLAGRHSTGSAGALATCLAIAIATLSTLSVLATPAAAAPGRTRVVTYAGSGATVRVGHLGPLRRTSKGFASFIDKRLHQLPDEFHEPSCTAAATVTVKRWRSDGYAVGLEGMDFSYDNGACSGGENWVLFKRFAGAWHVLLQGYDSESPYCYLYALAGVPLDITTTKDMPTGCIADADGGTTYRYYVFDRTTFFSVHHGFTSAIGSASAGEGPWLGEATGDKLWDVWNGPSSEKHRPTLRTGRCFSTSDPTYGRWLGKRKQGCLLYADTGHGHGDIYVMQMAPLEGRSAYTDGTFDQGMWRGVGLPHVGTF